MKAGGMLLCLAAVMLLCGACTRIEKENYATPEIIPKATESPPENGVPLAYTVAARDESNDREIKTAQYPITGIAQIDSATDAIVDDALAEPVGEPNGCEGMMGSVNVGFDVDRNDDIFAITYRIETFYVCAAHGTTTYLTRNYDMPSAAHIRLEDLFVDNDYALRLSALAIEKLRQLDIDVPDDTSDLSPDTWFYQGVSADAENFQNFLILPEGLRFVFSNYQVAPYAVGQVCLTIPWAEIEDIMTPAWRQRTMEG